MTSRSVPELFVAADDLGYDVARVVRHHVSLEGGGLPSPWTFLAHAAARTKRIRLATAITILPLERAVRLAEDVAVVDTLSGGRVEIGVGSGSSALEYAAFGRDAARKRELTSEGLAVLRTALANQEVGAPGFTIQPPVDDFTARADPFVAAWDQARAPRNGLSRFIFPAADQRTALAQIGADVKRAAEQFDAAGGFPAGVSVDEALRRFHSFYGHPDEIVAELQQERVLPVASDLIAQFNPAVPEHDAAIPSLELLATEIAPGPRWQPTAPAPVLAGV